MVSARSEFRQRLESGPPVLAPVCLDPLSARLIERLGFEAAYLSGGALGFQLAVSEALLTTTEVAGVARQITMRSQVPLIVDIAVGFGDPLHTTRAIWELEAAGAAAVELEDQVAPKRAHHHKGVEHMISLPEMVEKIEAAVAARRDPDLLIIARTAAVRNESFESALERARAYAGAGADLLMLSGGSEEHLRRAGRELPAPLALMGVAGRWSQQQLIDANCQLYIDPFTGQVEMYRAMKEAYSQIREHGTADRPTDELMGLYREIHEVAGMEFLYEIEARTTEKDSA
jgi:methylisocitrate lyase